MRESPGHFDLDSPKALFQKTTEDYLSFFDKPHSFTLFNVLADLKHLAEWICPEADGRKPKDSYSTGSSKQRFYFEIWHNPNYQLVKELCNRAKHFEARINTARTDVADGARAGLARSGDSLGQTYFLVDGQDIRVILRDVYKLYKTYFEHDSNTNG